jgi:four helix bundle protein
MVENNVLSDKALAFGIRIVNGYKYLVDTHKEFVMSKQILRCGTSIGANSFEAIYAQSKADFISKLGISLKEASETSYWLTLLHKTSYIDDSMYTSMKKDLDEIIRIIVKTIKTTRQNEQQKD